MPRALPLPGPSTQVFLGGDLGGVTCSSVSTGPAPSILAHHRRVKGSVGTGNHLG